jgi:hypothetical protein
VSLVLIRSHPVVTAFLDSLSDSLKSIKPSAKLTSIQKLVLTTLIVGILVTETLNWAVFDRMSLGKFKSTRICWIVYSAKIAWQHMLEASVRNILSRYGTTSGTIVIDDSSKKRSKNTTRIEGAHKVKDKSTGGYFNGQELIFMILVTDIATFPVGFRFYVPDPKLSAWRKNDKKLKKKGIVKKARPTRPEPDHSRFPTLQMLALDMIREFVSQFPNIKIKGVLADALYSTGKFMDEAASVTGQSQVVSQLRSNQKVSSRNSEATLKDYFARQKGVERRLIIRGGKEKTVSMLAARLHVKAHNRRRFIVALKYEGEEEYRYLVASDLSWHHADIAKLYSLRWLVEVFIQDWKAYGGWNRLSKQQGKEGSERGLILSLLCDHALLLHPEQLARLKNKQPGLPTGCLVERIKADVLVDTVRDVVASNDPQAELELLASALKKALPTSSSSKHMSGRSLGRQEPTASLRYHAQKAA